MTISITTLGQNSKVMSVDNDTIANILATIRDIIVTSGWEIWDQVSTTNVVLRNKCYDGVNYKYLQLLISASALNVSTYEGWNNSTHVGTNLAYYDIGGSSTSVTISTNMCNISLFYSARYVHFIVNNNPSVLASNVGVFEFYRDNPTDLPANGFPNFLITSSPGMQSGGNTGGGVAYYNTVGGVPRNRYGLTGKPAAAGNAFMSPIGVSGIFSGDGSSTTQNANAVIAYPSTTGAAIVATPCFITNMVTANALSSLKSLNGVDATASKPDFRGRVFGLKLIPAGYGNNGDVVQVPVDANGFSDSSSGTLADHMLFTYFALPL